MTGFPVADDLYRTADRRMREIKRRLDQKNGCPVDPQLILDKLQEIVDLPASGKRTAPQHQVVHIPVRLLAPDSSLQELAPYFPASSSAVYLIRRKTWIETLGDLTYFTAEEIEDLRGLGPQRLESLRRILQAARLDFALSRGDRSAWIMPRSPARLPIPPERVNGVTVSFVLRLGSLDPPSVLMQHLSVVLHTLGDPTLGQLLEAGRADYRSIIIQAWVNYVNARSDFERERSYERGKRLYKYLVSELDRTGFKWSN